MSESQIFTARIVNSVHPKTFDDHLVVLVNILKVWLLDNALRGIACEVSLRF